MLCIRLIVELIGWFIVGILVVGFAIKCSSYKS
jgi:hypothetical protein